MWKPCLGLMLMLPATLALADPATCPTDAAAVKALDTEYQAAVEKSDAARMDRLLADDFTLVSSKGVVYHKADLLKEARTPSSSMNTRATRSRRCASGAAPRC